MKELILFLSDKKILLGIGIGIFIGTIGMLGAKINYQMNDYQVEKRARSMGMEYPEEAKVILDKEVKK